MSGPLAPEAISARDERTTRGAALLIAVATLLGGICGYLQATTASDSSDTAERAQRLGIEAMGALLRGQQDAQVEYETYALAVEQRTQASNVQQQMLSLGLGPDAERLRLEKARWEELASRTEALSEISSTGPDGPLDDPLFPARFFARRAMDASRLQAEQDAENETLALVEGHVATYTAALAIIAVSLYLIGLGLTVRERVIRRSFTALALALVAAAAVLIVQTITRPGVANPVEAADAYAEARFALDTAFDRDGYHRAEEAYDRVVQLRPTFARAYVERAGVIFLGASPQRSGFPSLAPAADLERARADLHRARELGLRSASVYGSLGFYGYLQGVQEGRRDVLEQAVADTRRALELDDRNPIFAYNLGVTLLAADRPAEADEAYRRAVEVTLYLDPARTQLRFEPYVEQSWVAGALTDLEILVRYRPDLRAEVDRIKTELVTRVSARTLDAPPPGGATVAPEMRLDVYPGQLQWLGDLPGYTETDVVTTEWYHDDLGWSVLASVSGRAGSAGTTAPVGTDTDGNEYVLVSYLDSLAVPDCLPDGDYRVEIYVNDHLAATASSSASFGGLTAFAAPDLGLKLCRPADWVAPAEELPGLVRGTVGPEGDRGLYLFRIGLTGTLRSSATVAEDVLDVVVTSFGPLFPATPTYDEASGTTNDYFMGLGDTARRWYTYDGGFVRAGAGIAGDGSAVVALLYGDIAWFDLDEPYRILDSMVFSD